MKKIITQPNLAEICQPRSCMAAVYRCRANDSGNSQTAAPTVSGFIRIKYNEFLHPLILPVFLSLSRPPFALPSTYPRLYASFPSFLFFLLRTAYCSILKVPVCVLSCPPLPSMHCSDLELCRLRIGAHF